MLSPVSKCSSPAQKAFIASDQHVRLQCEIVFEDEYIAETVSLLTMNAFVCSVLSYSEVSSADYLVANDECVCLQCAIEVKCAVFGSYFRNNSKKNRN